MQRKSASKAANNIQSNKLENAMETAVSEQVIVTQDMVDQLRMALEDMTAVCILEGFQKQEHLMLVDSILKELGKPEI